jgi:pimeloyl-ACP methyl ester carboxylesterase
LASGLRPAQGHAFAGVSISSYANGERRTTMTSPLFFARTQCVGAASAALIAAGLWLATAAPSRAESDPLIIAKQGYFFVGGRIEHERPGSPTVGHMYVEFQVPQPLAHPYPVIMIHGGNQTGTNFTGTPDGREGWAQNLLRRGYAVYVVDQVARGRAAQWSAIHGPVGAANLGRLEQRFVAPERFNLWPQARLHTQWPGEGKPGDPAFDQFYASQFPSLTDFPLQQALNRDAVVALLDRIGPAVLLIHSQSGAFVWPIADARPNLVKAIVAVEPNGPPAHDVDFMGAPEWFADNPHLKAYGLTDVPLTYDPPLGEASALSFVREAKAERGDLVRCYAQQEPARKLVNLQHIPVLVVTSEASYHASYDHCTVRYLAQAGVASTFLRLGEAGIHGNGHMMMLERNSEAISGAMADWLDRTLPAAAR